MSPHWNWCQRSCVLSCNLCKACSKGGSLQLYREGAACPHTGICVKAHTCACSQHVQGLRRRWQPSSPMVQVLLFCTCELASQRLVQSIGHKPHCLLHPAQHLTLDTTKSLLIPLATALTSILSCALPTGSFAAVVVKQGSEPMLSTLPVYVVRQPLKVPPPLKLPPLPPPQVALRPASRRRHRAVHQLYAPVVVHQA